MSSDKLALTFTQVDEVKQKLQDNLVQSINRGDKQMNIEEKAKRVAEDSKIFEQRVKEARKRMCLRNWKFWLLVFIILCALGIFIVFLVSMFSSEPL